MPKISLLPAVTDFTVTTDVGVGVIGGTTSKYVLQNAGHVERGHPVASGGTRVGIPGVTAQGVNTFAVTANTIYYEPFLVLDPITVDACVCHVTSTGGTIARLGILAADTAWQPSSVTKDAGTVATTGTGQQVASFTAQVLQPGRYVKALVSDGAPAFRGLHGVVTFGEVDSATSGNLLVIRRSLAAAGTGALSAANDWDTLALSSANPQMHMVFLRITGV